MTPKMMVIFEAGEKILQPSSIEIKRAWIGAVVVKAEAFDTYKL